MRLLIIRHGDPDYINDSLTEKGIREAELLSDRIAKEKIDRVYISPLGRARKTAEACLKKMDPELKPVTYDWLKEFAPRIKRPVRPDADSICWDWMPEDWTGNDIFFDYDNWTKHPVFTAANVKEEIDYVTSEFEKLLKELGYERDGRLFKAVRPNNDTIAFFCHFGLESVLLSYLLNIPTMLLWHGFIAAPTSVTTVYTEERREGKAYFRVAAFGDTSHLYVGNEPPAFSGRFCECFTNENERH